MKLSSPTTLGGGFGSLSHVLNRWFPTPKFLQSASVGVDVSDVSVKWIALGPDARARVRSYGTLPISEGVVVGGVIKDVNALSDVLGELARRGITEAHAALPEEAAYVFTVSVPDGSSHDQVLRMVEFEFEGRVPISPEASVYDFDFVSDRGANGMREVGVVVFPRELAEDYVTVFNKARIRLLSLELEARSIARAVASGGDAGGNSVSLLVDFGRLRSGIAVLKRDVPIFTATIELGGERITRTLVEKLSFKTEDAEQFRNEHGLLADPKQHAKELEIVAATASALADEISRYYHFWDTRKSEEGRPVTPVSHVTLVGGSANLKGLEEYIAGRVQAPTRRADVWHNAFSYNDYIPPIRHRASLGYATSIGLALRGA